jgi:hypothetical protein
VGGVNLPSPLQLKEPNDSRRRPELDSWVSVVVHRLSEAPSGRLRPDYGQRTPRDGRQSSAEDPEGELTLRDPHAAGTDLTAELRLPTTAHSGRGLQLDDRQVPHPTRARRGKPRTRPRVLLRATSPVLDPTGLPSKARLFSD